MATDWEDEGLLKEVRGRPREARRELLDDLESQGFSVEELRRAVAEDRLALLQVERVLAGDGPRYTAAELAERSGHDEEFLRRIRQAHGLPFPEPDERSFTDGDVEAARILKQVLDGGMPEDGILETTRVLGNGMANYSEAVIALFAEAFLERGDTELDVATRFAEAARQMAPYSAAILPYVLNLHMREQVQRQMIRRAEMASGHVEGATDVTVCFGDLVDFTRLGEQLSADELGGIAGRLNELATEVTTRPVRLVKMIGDAAMLVSQEPEPLLETALALSDAVEAEGEDFPQLRVGIANGEALHRGGDWYGRPVNLASRITSFALPGSLVGTDEVREADPGDRYAWSHIGRRPFKGIDGEVELYRLRREAEPDGAT